jgi:hypothetical protein
MTEQQKIDKEAVEAWLALEEDQKELYRVMGYCDDDPGGVLKQNCERKLLELKNREIALLREYGTKEEHMEDPS